MRHRGRPLLRDARRTRAWPVLAACVATVLGVLLHDPARPAGTRVARAALVVVACAGTALVAAGVIGLRWHYFTDTVGGVALGTGTALTLALLIDLVPGAMRSRRSPPWPRSGPGPSSAPTAAGSAAAG